MYTLTHYDITLYISGSYNETDNIFLVEVFTSSANRASIVLTPSMEGVITPLTYMGGRVLSVCYLPDATIEDITDLGASTTAFATKQGLLFPSASEFSPYLVDDAALQFLNPRDVLYYVIPASRLEAKSNIGLSDNWAHIIMQRPIKHYTIAIYSPVKGHDSLYMIKAEGNDCLSYTDMEEGYVVRVSYVEDNKTVNKYIRVS